MEKEQLKKELEAQELVKPNKIEERLSKEVEALCDGFCSGMSNNYGRGAGDTENGDDILF